MHSANGLTDLPKFVPITYDKILEMISFIFVGVVMFNTMFAVRKHFYNIIYNSVHTSYVNMQLAIWQNRPF